MRRVTLLAMLTGFALIVAGCGVSTGPGSSSGAAARPETSGVGRQQAPPASAAQTQPAPLPPPKGTLLVVTSAAPGPYRTLAVTLTEIGLRNDKEWLAAASDRDLAALNKQPVNLAGEAPLLLGVGSAPAGAYQALRLRFKSGPSACYLETAEAPKRRRPLALPKEDAITLSVDKVTLEAGRTRVLALRVDPSGAAPEGDGYRLAPKVFSLGDASKVVGAISGSVAPASALARVWAWWADPPTPINWSDADPADGAFTVPDLPPGDYFLRISAGGREPIEDRSATYTVKAGATAKAAPASLAPRPR